MKKRILLSTILILTLGIIISNAQCVPAAKTSSAMLIPDTIVNFPDGAAKQYYQAMVSLYVPKDTFYNGFTFSVDSIGLISITGLPKSLTWTTNSKTTPNPYWNYKTPGCVIISGTPTSKEVGTYRLTFQTNIRIGSGLANLPYPFPGYKITIKDSTHIGIEEINDNKIEVYQNSPNPFSEKTNIVFNTNIPSKVNFIVYDIFGKKVFLDKIQSTKGINTYEFSANNLLAGIYYYEINNGKNSEIRKMIIYKE